MGFGARIQHGKPGLKDDYKGEWELGTYGCAWRVIGDGKILCGSDDSVDSIDELDRALNHIAFGAIISLQRRGRFDICIELDNNMAIDFFASASDDDELFHIFCPGNKYVRFTAQRGWALSDSDKPWSEPPGE